MLKQKTPRGLEVNVPESEAEDKASRRFALHQLRDAADYYDKNGYCIMSGIIEHGTCDGARELWVREVKPSNQLIYRQATARLERHSKNERGWIMNPILNLQSVDPAAYPEFRAYSTNQILTHASLTQTFRALLRDDPMIVQSMYFEGNSETWEHQDSYYLDSSDMGRMAAAWIALEDIDAEAGRFFVCPESHRIDLGRHTRDFNIAENHELYIEMVVAKIKDLGYEIRAPALKKGDVLFWNSRTVHGSLASQSETRSRSSITCHAIPCNMPFLQLQMRSYTPRTDTVNGVQVYRPKDLARMRNRLVHAVEGTFPRPFYWAKKTAIKHFAPSS